MGLEYNPTVGELVPTLNWILQEEHAEHNEPLIAFGTSSDRIFSPEGTRAYFLTVGKSFLGGKVSPYVGASWSEWEDTLLVPFGTTVALAPAWDAMVQHDGRNTHWLLTYKSKETSTSLLLVKGRFWGVSMGVRF